LEYLCGIEETVVRDAAVASINNLLSILVIKNSNPPLNGEEDMALTITNTVKRLASSDWFPSKVCAAGIIPAIYTSLTTLYSYNPTNYPPHAAAANNNNTTANNNSTIPSKQRLVRQHMHTLSSDDNPLVRRSCAKHLKGLIEAVISHDDQHPMNKGKNKQQQQQQQQTQEDEDVLLLMTMYRSLIMDESDTVRLLAVQATSAMARHVINNAKSNKNINEICQFVRACTTDASWRVRDSCGKCFGEIITALHIIPAMKVPGEAIGSNSNNTSYLCTLYSQLLSDHEAEVRASAVGCLSQVTRVAVISNNNGNSNSYVPIATIIPKLADDSILEVRRNLAREIMDIAPSLSHDFVLKTYRSTLETLLTDEYPEVQLAIMTDLPHLASLLPSTPTLVSSLLSMTNSSNWRVRLNCVLMLSSLCEYLGDSFYLENLANPFFNFLMDPVAEVRSSCIVTARELSKVCGMSWCHEHLLPNLLALYSSSNGGKDCYLTRVTLLRCAAALISTEKMMGEVEHSLVENVIQFLLTAMLDKVANVRLVAARCLSELYITNSNGNVGKDNVEDSQEASPLFEYLMEQWKSLEGQLEHTMQEEQDEECQYYLKALNDVCAAR